LSTRRRLRAHERRELIEQAATEVFAERGYAGASIDEIVRRAGVSAPVLYDHFSSKQEPHRHLLERHYAELREIWRLNVGGEEEAGGERIARAFDAWFGYVEAHPYAWRMLFREDSGDPEAEAIRREVATRSRAALLPLYVHQPGADRLAGPNLFEAGWEVLRGALQSLALWWYDHREVPREQIVALAMNAIWLGFERLSAGEAWQPRVT
jgi:AcrR family transcriptional regulator